MHTQPLSHPIPHPPMVAVALLQLGALVVLLATLTLGFLSGCTALDHALYTERLTFTNVPVITATYPVSNEPPYYTTTFTPTIVTNLVPRADIQDLLDAPSFFGPIGASVALLLTNAYTLYRSLRNRKLAATLVNCVDIAKQQLGSTPVAADTFLTQIKTLQAATGTRRDIDIPLYGVTLDAAVSLAGSSQAGLRIKIDRQSDLSPSANEMSTTPTSGRLPSQ